MKIYPMNKTAIVSFILDSSLLKLWNLSKNMRKRLKWLVEGKTLILAQYDPRAFMLTNWIRIRKRDCLLGNLKDMRKGVSNYTISTREQLNKLISLNSVVKCAELVLEQPISLEIDQLLYIYVSLSNYDFYAKCSFKSIGALHVKGLSAAQIANLFKRIEKVKKFKIWDSTLPKLDLSLKKTENAYFNSVKFNDSVVFCSYLRELRLIKCEIPSLPREKSKFPIRFKNLEKLSFFTKKENFTQNHLNWLKSLKGLKHCKIDKPADSFIKYLPSTVRTVISSSPPRFENVDLKEIKANLPYLLSLDEGTSIEIAEILNLRMICPKMEGNTGKFSLKPRKVTVNNENYRKLSKNAALLEKIEHFEVNSDKFKFDCLPAKIKKIWLFKVNLESNSVTRF